MSNLLVQNIKHTNGTTAQTISSSGEVTQDQMTFSTFGWTGNQTVSSSAVMTWWANLDGDSNITFMKGIGPQPTVSSGVFTFPSTGMYEMHLCVGWYGTNDAYVGASIDITPDGDFSGGSSQWNYTQIENYGATGYASLSFMTHANVTSTDFRARCRYDHSASSSIRDKYYTRLCIKKIAAEQ
tara:strand:- start:1865 stop:2413 length:549 start_codon:yes stop_codon:yes gene_type:complete